MAILKEIKFLRGDYTDLEIIDLLVEPEIKSMLKAATIRTIGQWRSVGKKLQVCLKHSDMNVEEIRALIAKWGKQFNPTSEES